MAACDCCTVVSERKGDSSVGGTVWLLEFQVRQRRYKWFHGLGRYRGVRSKPRVSPVRRFSRRAEELFQKVPGETEGEPSVWGEGQGTDRGHQRVLVDCQLEGHSSYECSLGGSQKVRRGHSTEFAAFARLPFLCQWQLWQCKGDKEFLVLLHCSKAALLSRGILGLCRVSLSFGSLLFVIWSRFFQVFSLVLYMQRVLCKLSVWTKHMQAEWLVLPSLIPGLELLKNPPFCFPDFPPSLAMTTRAWACWFFRTSLVLLCWGYQQQGSDWASSWQSWALCIWSQAGSVWDEIMHFPVTRGLLPKKTQGMEH